MPLTERSVSGFPILDLSGQLTGSLGNEMLARVHAIAAAGGRDVLLNLTLVSYIDSEGLGTMAAAVSALRGNAGALRLLYPSPWARELLRITALNSLMESFDSEISAIESMLNRPIGVAPGGGPGPVAT
jgi:anti-sigma B factor antagonist